MNRADCLSLRRACVRASCAALALVLAACGSVGTGGGGGMAGSAAMSTGAAALSWSPVTQTLAGTALTDLAGYNVYYGSAPDNLNNVVRVADPAATNYIINSLSFGTWYFGVAAFTNTGLESPLSDVVSKTIE